MGYCQDVLKVQARWILLEELEQKDGIHLAISSYAEKKNGAETGAGTNRKPVEVARRSLAPEICVEGAVCRLEGTFV